MECSLFDTEAEATDEDDVTENPSSSESENWSEEISYDESVNNEMRPMPLLEKDLLDHPENSVIKYCRKMNGSRGTESSYSHSGSSSCDGEDEVNSREEVSDGDDEVSSKEGVEDREDEVNYKGGEDGNSTESCCEEDNWLKRKLSKPTIARKRADIQRLLNEDSDGSYGAAEPNSTVIAGPERKKRRIHFDDDE
jgi:hypothetical protein